MSDESLDALRQRLQKRDRQMDAVHRISAALFSRNDLDELLRQTLHASLEIVDAVAGSILLYENERRVLVFRYVVGKMELINQTIDPEADVHGKAATVFRTGKSILTTDPRNEGYNPAFDEATGFRTQSIVTVPLKSMGGEPIGVMQALNKRQGHFDEDDLEILEIVSGLAATTIMNARLAEEAQLSAVARAVGDLSHDIKNALTPIETMIETTVEAFIEPMYADLDRMFHTQRTGNEEVIHYVEKAVQPLREWYPEMRSSVQDGCEDIREMVSEIADYIKGAQATNMEYGSIDEVVRERLRRLRVVAGNRRVQIHIDGFEAVPPFCFDRRLLGRAIFNLVNNALGAINDAVKKRTLALRPEGYNVWVRATAVTEGAYPVGRYCLIEVQDDGPGIPPHVKASLFTQNTISTTPGGTGIGTRFVKSVANAHNGYVGVESEPGCGALFWIKLPL
jgi:signal transduction histidine kinase